MLLNPYRFGVVASTGVFFAQVYDKFFSSSDGATWSELTMPNGAWSWQVSKVGVDFVTVGYNVDADEPVVTSSDGETWVPQTAPLNDYGWYGTATDGSRIVAIGQSGAAESAMYSDDAGLTWTLGDLTLDAWSSVLWAPGPDVFIVQAMGGTDAIAVSEDGETWTLKTVTDGVWGVGVGAWSGTKYRCVGKDAGDGTSIVLKSADGSSFSTSSAGIALESVTWGPTIWTGSQFVAIAVDPSDPGYTYIVTSPDGDTWTQSVVKISKECQSLVFDGTNYFAGQWQSDDMDGFEVYKSADLVTWTLVGQIPAESFSLAGIRFVSLS